MDKHDVFLRAFAILGIGGAGIYLMLPRGQSTGHGMTRWIGGLLATVSLVLLATVPAAVLSGAAPAGSPVPTATAPGGTGTFLWCLDTWASCATFYLLAFITLASAIMTITSRNPVYSALWFALVLLANSGLYLLQRAEFLAAATIIIYAGAIIVTFLFVIMLAQPAGTAPYDRLSREPLFACLSGVLLAGVLVGTIHYAGTAELAPMPRNPSIAEKSRPRRPKRLIIQETLAAAAPGDRGTVNNGSWRIEQEQPHVAGLGRTLFLDHYVSIEVIGVLLLVAVVGAMLIAGKTETRSADVRRSVDVQQ